MNKVHKDRQSSTQALFLFRLPLPNFYKIHRHLSTIPDDCSPQRKQTLNPGRELPIK